MSDFFSCISVGDGKPLYFDWELRKKVLSGELRNYRLDSHTSIADYFGYKGILEDAFNKYEYNPLTREFKVNQLNTKDDSELVKSFLDSLNWKTVVEPLIIKPIVHPFRDRKAETVTPGDLELLKKWVSLWTSIGDPAWDSLRVSIGALIGALVEASLGNSIRVSIRGSIGASLWASVGASIETSLKASHLAYISSFLDIKYQYDFSPVIKLWERGLVPSFDGETWRLHGFPNGEILWEEKEK